MGKALIRLWAGHRPTTGRNVSKQGQDEAQHGSRQNHKAPSTPSHLSQTLRPGGDMGRSGGPHPKSSTRAASKEGAVTPLPSAKPLSHGCSAPHLTAHPVLVPTHPLGSDAKSQILLFSTTPRPPPPPLDHAITHMTVYCLSPEKLNKIPQKRPREGEQAALAEAAVPKAAGSQVPICKAFAAPSKVRFCP